MRKRRSEEHTSELQSRSDLVCRLLLEKKNQRDSLPSVNYSRGVKIDITLAAGKVDRVFVTGRADGVQLEPAPPDTTKKQPSDTTKKAPDKTKKPKAPVR